jgi:hypothetical protein
LISRGADGGPRPSYGTLRGPKTQTLSTSAVRQ